jgi:peptidoglycan/LPS O-acetylase OafA/YrhL
MKYRPEIDGLRAIAVLPVIIYHAGPSLISGGYLGVDIFFVISGYLITSIIVNEINEGKFSLLSFYERRAKRILPALAITVILTCILTPFFLIPSQIKDVAQSVVATALFVSNFFFYLETDYFNQFTNHAPLLHTWSLAVEEQFYIAFPIILYLFRDKLFTKYSVTIVILLVSITLAELTIDNDKSLAFYGIHTRAWELMIGAGAAFVIPTIDRFAIQNTSTGHFLTFEFIAIASLVSIFICYILFNQETRHPGIITALPVASSALLIVSIQHSNFTKRALSHPILVYIGLISYGLYLYHNPIFSFIDIQHDQSLQDSLLVKLLFIPVIFIIAFLSYKYIETPIRRSKSLSWKQVFVPALSINFIFILSGYAVHKANGFQQYYAELFIKEGGVMLVDVDTEKKKIEQTTKLLYPSDKDFTCKDCEKLLVVGDSFANDAYLSLASKANKKYDVRKIYLDDTCMTEALEKLKNNKGLKFTCKNRNSNIRLLDQADIIIITAKWQEHTDSSGYNLASYLSHNPNISIYVVGSVMFTDLSSMSLKFARDNITPKESASIMYKYQRWDRVTTSNHLRSLVLQDTKIKWIEKRDFFCDTTLKKCDLFNASGQPLIWDNAHLTKRAYLRYAEFLLDYIRNDSNV